MTTSIADYIDKTYQDINRRLNSQNKSLRKIKNLQIPPPSISLSRGTLWATSTVLNTGASGYGTSLLGAQWILAPSSPLLPYTHLRENVFLPLLRPSPNTFGIWIVGEVDNVEVSEILSPWGSNITHILPFSSPNNTVLVRIHGNADARDPSGFLVQIRANNGNLQANSKVKLYEAKI